MTLLRVRPELLDLELAPGVAEGQRHRHLSQMVVAHFGRGQTAEAVEALALAWASRCEPPLDEDDVRKIVANLAKKHERPIAVVSPAVDEIDDVPLPERPPWPVLDPAALYGPAGAIVRTFEPHTEADPVGLLISALVALGNCIGREPSFAVEGDLHHVNLFAVMVGDSARGRKGTSLGRVLSLFDEIDSDWTKKCMATGLSSGEGLIWAVHDPIQATEPLKEKGAVTGYQVIVKDPGVEDKRLLVNESEFAQALRVLRREGNTLSPVIRQAWDKGDLKALTKNTLAQATDAHISILGHITQPELVKYLDDTDCWNGFANRFLWAVVRRSKLLPDGGQQVDLLPLKKRLEQGVAIAREIGAMRRDDQARSYWNSLYPELTAERPGLHGAVTGRAEAQVLRLSMLYALLDGTASVGVTHLKAAAALWHYCDHSARLIFAGDHGEQANPLEKAILATIRQQPGINRKGLHKALGGHIQAAIMVQALARLRDRGLIRAEIVPTRGRPSECWHPQHERKSSSVPTVGSDDGQRKEDAVAVAEVSSFIRTSPNDSPNGASVTPDAADGSSTDNPAPEICPGPEVCALPLVDLLSKVREAGGKIVRSAAGAFTVQGVGEGFLTLSVRAALVNHRDELDVIVPSPPTATTMDTQAKANGVSQASEIDPELPSRASAEGQDDDVDWNDPFMRELKNAVDGPAADSPSPFLPKN